MPEMVRIAEIAKRLGVDLTTVRRLIARESEALQLELHRGKGDKLLLSKEDAEKLVASYEARRGPIVAVAGDASEEVPSETASPDTLEGSGQGADPGDG